VIDATDVLISGEAIAAVGKHLTVPPHAKVLDARGMTLLPGLIESHCHTWSPDQLRQAAVLGVTTELSMTGPSREFREQVRKGQFPDGADLRGAGLAFMTPGGHGTEYGFEVPTIDKVSQVEAFMRDRIAEGSDFIKFMVDDGLTWGMRLTVPSDELLSAGVAAAHTAGKLAVVHAGSLEDAWRAVRAGADGLAHIWSGGPQPQLIEAIAQKGMFVASTLSLQYAARAQGQGYELLEDPEIGPYLPQENVLYGDFLIAAPGDLELQRKSVAALHARAVPILVGTDAAGEQGVDHGASVHGELRLLTEAGLTPIAALRGATSLPSQRFGLRDRGRIASGLMADLLLVRGDPTTDIRATRAIVGVWRKGKQIDREAYRARIAAAAKRTLPPAPPLMVGDFEATDSKPPLGQGWMGWTDKVEGGKSSVTLDVVGGGAAASRRSLRVTGTLVEDRARRWSGALYSPSPITRQPTDLSSWKKIAFWAKGDGARYLVIFLFGEGVRTQFFVARGEWTKYEFDFRKFGGTLATNIRGILFGAASAGPYSLQLDQVELR
jgi:imidazolonepropionase-like amidohydrolase